MVSLHCSGWVRDLPDQRDFKYSISKPIIPAPSKLDLSKHPAMPPIYDQLNLGSCTAFSIGSVVEFERREVRNPDFVPSWLFIYYNERVIENTVNSDCGAQIRDGIKAVAKQGVCSDKLWPYVVKKYAVRPPITAFNTAKNYVAIKYSRVDRSIDAFKACLCNTNLIVFGFSVYSSFLSDTVARTGIMSMPALNESLEGGHAIVAVGYDDSKKSFLIRNSWGRTWGLNGYFWMPYEYITRPDLSADFWTISAVTN